MTDIQGESRLVFNYSLIQGSLGGTAGAGLSSITVSAVEGGLEADERPDT